MTAAGLQAMATPRWRLGWLFAAPHRLAFTAAAALFGVSALWWASVLLMQAQALPLRWTLPPAQAHGLLMTLGFMPLFFCGFLFTAGPRWLQLPPVEARSLMHCVLAQLAGWAVFMLAAHGPDAEFGRVLGGLGVAAVAAGWSQACWKLRCMLRASQAVDRLHLRVILWAGVFGACTLWTAAIATGEPAVVRSATMAGAWGFVGVVFVAALHRMIGFFGGPASPALDARWPNWLLWSLSLLLAGVGCVAIVDALGWQPPVALRWLRAGVEGAAGIVLLALAVRWGRVQRLQARLLAMLHLAWVWLGLAFLLSGLSQMLLAASANTLSLGLAPLHAYTIGFLASTLLAMVARISCGQAGRTVAADNFIWRLFWVLQVAALARIAAAVVDASGGGHSIELIVVAALAWAAVCVSWALRHVWWYGTPRIDGRPG